MEIEKSNNNRGSDYLILESIEQRLQKIQKKFNIAI